jgi:GH15 family glucan-1,4-alpha-glucosidase
MTGVPARIEDYALVGDCESAALISNRGSVDWLCWPRFDSDACFAALVGAPENGHWVIEPVGEYRLASRRYRGNTLVLETRFETDTGAVLIVDFMPPRQTSPHLVRLVVGERGTVRMRTRLVVSFGYGDLTPWWTRANDDRWRAIGGPDLVAIAAPLDLRQDGDALVGATSVSAGESLPFVLSYGPSNHGLPRPIDVADALEQCEDFWNAWIHGCRKIERWSKPVIRSLITLRAMIYKPTGGIVAAPTTSLPECPGGRRNWDYRYCWLRDATLTLLALMDAGFREEASAWRGWLLRAVAGEPNEMQIMYGVGGERRLIEWSADWLRGHRGAQPVRIGNAAYRQRQLDVYGEVIDALHQARQNGIDPIDHGWTIQRGLLEHLATAWRQPDQGIWEVRGPARHWTYSKILCWVAFDRAIRDCERFGLEGPVQEWRRIRDAIHAQVCERGYDPGRRSFVQAYDSANVDASLLLIPELGFLPVDDPRVLGTIRAIERDLLRDGLVQRYDTEVTDDGMPPGEGAFLACSFWLADAYVLSGRRGEAEALFEHLLSLGNDVGLLPEQYSARDRCMLGNFPQALSHLSLVATAFNLSDRPRPAEQRAEA